jgi:hypothetical protein
MVKGDLPRLEGGPASGLKACREVITPHSDMAKGSFAQAQAGRRGEGSSQYGQPGKRASDQLPVRCVILRGVQGRLESPRLPTANQIGDLANDL